VGLLEEFRQTLGVVIRAVLDRNGKVAPHNKASVAVFLEEKEAGGTLYVSEGFRRRFLEEIEPATARNGEAEVPHEFFIMLLADAEKIEDVLVQVVKEFHLRGLLMEKHLSRSSPKRMKLQKVSTP